MRRLTLCLFLLAIAFANCRALEETISGLKSRLEKASPDDRPELCIRIAQEQLRNADKLYTEGHPQEASAALDEMIAYTEKARDAALQTKKHLKNIEIDARKMAARLRDIKRTLAFEDQAPVEQAVRRLD